MLKLLLSLVLLTSCSKPDTIQNMINSVVIVNGSSGVIIHADNSFALVLTSHHVVANSIQNNLPIVVDSPPYTFVATGGAFDDTLDLSLLLLRTKSILPYSKIALVNPKLGDDIWIAANPNHNIRSLKKGVVSSTSRQWNGIHGWELSGGIIFGSSGGGAFNISGELFGIARAVDSYGTEFCKIGRDYEITCLRIALPDVGMFVPPDDIRKFVLGSEFDSYFDYLKE